MSFVLSVNSSTDILLHIVLDTNHSNISHNISWLSLMAPSCFSITIESQWSFESAEYGLGGRESSPVLISHMALLWQYSLHLSTIKPSLIQDTSSDGTPARGVLWDQQRFSEWEQMQKKAHKHKYYTEISVGLIIIKYARISKRQNGDCDCELSLNRELVADVGCCVQCILTVPNTFWPQLPQDTCLNGGRGESQGQTARSHSCAEVINYSFISSP